MIKYMIHACLSHGCHFLNRGEEESMGRMIDADKIHYESMLSARGNGQYEYVMVAYKDQIDDMPTIEPERKTGKWIYIRAEESGNILYQCSACNKGDTHAPEVEVPYCWNCGAKMETSHE